MQSWGFIFSSILTIFPIFCFLLQSVTYISTMSRRHIVLLFFWFLLTAFSYCFDQISVGVVSYKIQYIDLQPSRSLWDNFLLFIVISTHDNTQAHLLCSWTVHCFVFLSSLTQYHITGTSLLSNAKLYCTAFHTFLFISRHYCLKSAHGVETFLIWCV